MPTTPESNEGILQARVRMAANTALIMASISFIFGVDRTVSPYDFLVPFYGVALLGLMVAARTGSMLALALALGGLGVGSAKLVLMLAVVPDWGALIFLLGAFATTIYGMRGLDAAMGQMGRTGGGRS